MEEFTITFPERSPSPAAPPRVEPPVVQQVRGPGAAPRRRPTPEHTVGHALAPLPEEPAPAAELRMVPMPADLVEPTDHGEKTVALPDPGRELGEVTTDTRLRRPPELPAGAGNEDVTQVRVVMPPASDDEDVTQVRAVVPPRRGTPRPATPRPATPRPLRSRERDGGAGGAPGAPRRDTWQPPGRPHTPQPAPSTVPISGRPRLARAEDLGLDPAEEGDERVLAWLARGVGLALFAGVMLALGAAIAYLF